MFCLTALSGNAMLIATISSLFVLLPILLVNEDELYSPVSSSVVKCKITGNVTGMPLMLSEKCL